MSLIIISAPVLTVYNCAGKMKVHCFPRKFPLEFFETDYNFLNQMSPGAFCQKCVFGHFGGFQLDISKISYL